MSKNSNTTSEDFDISNRVELWEDFARKIGLTYNQKRGIVLELISMESYKNAMDVLRGLLDEYGKILRNAYKNGVAARKEEREFQDLRNLIEYLDSIK